jgi:hypothetical protein
MDVIVEWREQEVNKSKRVIWTWSMCNYKGRCLVVGCAQENIPSDRAKNSENHGEYDDVKDVIKELMKRLVDTLKGMLWGWPKCNMKAIALVVILAQGNITSARAKKNEIRWECHDLMNVNKQLTGGEVDTSKRVI